ncbi:MAG: hypothetical protein FD124_1148 [Alphaproteobacteria bacterium]|nr:MAG: hypothetical protein FD124_1148 [Alphaproteobacteria bacterium]
MRGEESGWRFAPGGSIINASGARTAIQCVPHPACGLAGSVAGQLGLGNMPFDSGAWPGRQAPRAGAPCDDPLWLKVVDFSGRLMFVAMVLGIWGLGWPTRAKSELMESRGFPWDSNSDSRFLLETGGQHGW